MDIFIKLVVSMFMSAGIMTMIIFVVTVMAGIYEEMKDDFKGWNYRPIIIYLILTALVFIYLD